MKIFEKYFDFAIYEQFSQNDSAKIQKWLFEKNSDFKNMDILVEARDLEIPLI